MKGYRIWVMWLAAAAVIFWFWATDPDGGAETVARLQWLAWLVVAAGPVYLLRRAFLDRARSAEAYRRALEGPTGSGLVFLGLSILTGLLFLAFASRAGAAELPPMAMGHIPTLRAELASNWPDAPHRSAFAAQVEQETCVSLKSAKCWNPRAELKTSREYGFGLGQITVTKRFDNFSSARGLHPSLRDWKWADRYDAPRQLRTLVLMDRNSFRRLSSVSDHQERLAMAFGGYNGGDGGVQADRRLCASIEGCDPGCWFGHVEKHSLKSKVKSKGYGKSFYEINREYVRSVMLIRSQKYREVMGESS